MLAFVAILALLAAMDFDPDQRQEDAAQRKTTAQAEQRPHVRHMRLLTLVKSVVC